MIADYFPRKKRARALSVYSSSNYIGADLAFVAGGALIGLVAGLQMITPNQMRGQVIAIFHFVGNIIGPAPGPIAVAVITDYIWKDEMAVGQSIATMYAIIIPVCCLLLWYGMSAFRRSMAEAESWTNISQKAQQ